MMKALPSNAATSQLERHRQVEQILGQRRKGRTVEFLVRWQGCGEEEDTWEPLKNLASCADMIDAFRESHTAAGSVRKPRGRGRSRTTKVTASSRSRSRSSSRGRPKSATRKSTRTQPQVTPVRKTRSDMIVATKSIVERETETKTASQVIQRHTDTRQITVTETRTVSKTIASSSPPRKESCAKNICNCLNLRRSDIPIIIVVACLAFIFISVLFMKRPSK
ncbi:uncharacterized protein LOC135495831 isoform X2 [Lineus longissimus]|uniref:uncharacterized protein LOC135495831 isoform X2 n=1 Tax=Lineus longissimus TaxID=88925 RepID=UPI002B4D8F23